MQEALFARKIMVRHGDESMDGDRFIGLLRQLTDVFNSWQLSNSTEKYPTMSDTCEKLWSSFSGPPSHDLTTLPFEYRERKATKDRDRVYSLLDLWRPQLSAQVLPDYSLTDHTVDINATKAAIYEDQSLDILFYAFSQHRGLRDPANSLPSWALDIGTITKSTIGGVQDQTKNY